MNTLITQMNLFLNQFHWLRPHWLLVLLPLLLLAIFLWRVKRQAHQWQQMIAPELLPFLLDGKTTATKKSLLFGLFLAWLLAAIALAGPSWVKRPTAVEKNQNALVILLDLSQSMITEDIKPSRIVRARLKINDLLRKRKDGQTALVVYAGDAHTVTPLSDDTGTMMNLLPTLTPSIMPSPGSNTEDAVQRGIQLLQDAGAPEGDLLLVTDGVVPEAFAKIRELVSANHVRLNILGVGTNQPAPIPAGNGGFLRDKQGNIITAQLNSSELQDLAQSVHGKYQEIVNNDSDIDALAPNEEKSEKSKPTLERDFDQWFDQGHWLIFIILPIVLFCFKRGFILMLLCLPLLIAAPTPVYAMGFEDMWQTKNQQAAQALQKGDAKMAAQEFESPEWKAAAQYRAGDYAAAAESYANGDSATAHYNRGNALAKAGKLEDAIKAYDEALKRDKNLEDAKKNRALVEKILKQKNQEKNQNQQDKKDQNDKSDKKTSDQKEQNSQDQDQKDQQNSTQKNQEKKDSEKKDSEKKPDQEKRDDKSADAKNHPSSNGSESSAQHQQQDSGQSSSASTQNQAQQRQQQSAQSSTTSSTQPQAGAQQSSVSGTDAGQQSQPTGDDKLNNEQKQVMEKWLRLVPDDPSGLLRKKFQWQYDQTHRSQQQGTYESPDNKADQRW